MVASLLPPNASRLERDIEQVIAGSLDLPLAIGDLWDPFRCPLSLLPWLAWAYSVDQWADSWPESIKRQVVNDAFEIHRYKGTPFAVQQALNSLGIKTNILEWWEHSGSGVRGTMKVLAMVNDNLTGESEGLLTANMLAMISEAIRVSKRGSIHFDIELGIAFEQGLTLAAALNRGIECTDSELQSLPILPPELTLGVPLLLASHQHAYSDYDLVGVI